MTDNINNIQDSADYQFSDTSPDRSFSDDGSVHIVRNGTRYCFNIGQDISRRDWTRRARSIGRQFGIGREEVDGWIRTEFGR